MATRKGWSELTPAYRSRLERAGINRTGYSRGETLQDARGHGKAPEHVTGYRRIAEQLGIGFIAPEYDELDQDEQSEVARDYVQGMMSRGALKRPKEIGGRTITQTVNQSRARERFSGWLLEARDGEFSKEDWQTYRAIYNAHFGDRKS